MKYYVRLKCNTTLKMQQFTKSLLFVACFHFQNRFCCPSTRSEITTQPTKSTTDLSETSTTTSTATSTTTSTTTSTKICAKNSTESYILEVLDYPVPRFSDGEWISGMGNIKKIVKQLDQEENLETIQGHP